MASIARANCARERSFTAWDDVCRGSGSDGAPQRLSGCDNFPPVIVAAMAANVVRPLQLAAIAAFGIGLLRQRLMAAAHAAAGGGGLSLGYGHGTGSS